METNKKASKTMYVQMFQATAERRCHMIVQRDTVIRCVTGM